jgi:electron transport complex protein RnfB
VRHDRCLNCNECPISVVCPSDAFSRIPADYAYLLKGEEADWPVSV